MTLEQLFHPSRIPIYGGIRYEKSAKRYRSIEGRNRTIEQSFERFDRRRTFRGDRGTGGIYRMGSSFWTELAGKAGLTRKEFSGLYRDASRAIANATGAERLLVLEGIQRAHSLGGTPEENKKLVELAGSTSLDRSSLR